MQLHRVQTLFLPAPYPNSAAISLCRSQTAVPTAADAVPFRVCGHTLSKHPDWSSRMEALSSTRSHSFEQCVWETMHCGTPSSSAICSLCIESQHGSRMLVTG